MSSTSQREAQRLQADVIIVGAGPAGIAALLHLLEAGRRVIWVEQSAQAGGQIWRAGLPAHWRAQVEAALSHPSLQCCFGHAVIDAHIEATDQAVNLRLYLPAQPNRVPVQVQAPQLLLATGGRERFLPFPGWTLPGITGAGGLQALVKQGWPIQGRRVVLAGSGPLLLAAADTVRQAGGQILLIAEQASRASLLRFAAGLPAAKAKQAAGLAWRLRGIPYRSGTWVQNASGDGRLQSIQLSTGRATWALDCDALGLGFGLLPNTEPAQMLGCQLTDDGAIAVDAGMATNRPGVYAAGECTGMGGVDKSVAEGTLAAQSMLGRAGASRPRKGALKFADHLQRHFSLRPEVLKLADTSTTVCRCEDVSLGQLKAHSDWREAKLQTRCGMGACQGRICGPICESLLGWPAQQNRGLRTPLQAAPLHLLAED